MPTKLSRYAEGVMEATWLAALLLVPVFFNIYSSRIFEPDKLTLLRTLTLVMLGAWLVKLFEQGGFRWDHISRQDGWLKAILRIPLIIPVCLLAASYAISTFFSITPFTSLWGSYQRLQGTYTTYSYLLFFASLVANLRQRSQVERLITVAILASLPVSLYGILQRFKADPIPWGGDVTGRIAANMGNSIFVAAFLIMVLPVTVMRVVESFEAMLADRGQQWPNFARSTAYVFILALQLIAIYFSGSRGPWLGLGVSLVMIWLGLSLIWRKRWLTISGVTLALVAGSFILLLNIPNGPLENLRSRPELGRLGQLLDAESRTGRVRTLIWQGASELMQPHEPLAYPDGRKDLFNFMRPLIGYGPESMYVAYNNFYPPELTQVEKRNASPDRSHNETWDSLVITGVVGLAVYLTLFGSLLYFGLKWLGLVPSRRDRNLYMLLYLLGGAVSTIAFILWGGIKFLGVALPFGMVFGVVIYLIYISIFGRVQDGISELDRLRAYTMLGLLASVTAHFVEINFGIAIAATRTYFWAYTALLLLVGFILPLQQEDLQKTPQKGRDTQTAIMERPGGKTTTHKGSGTVGRRKPASRRIPVRSTGQLGLPWLRYAIIVGLIIGLLLTTLGYEFVTNASREQTASGLVLASFTRATREGGRNGILPLMLTTWLIGAVLLASEDFTGPQNHNGSGRSDWLRIFGVGAGLALILAVVFWLWNAAGLASLGREAARTLEEVLRQVGESERILTTYYLQVFLILFASAFFFPIEWPSVPTRHPIFSPLVAAGLFVGVIAFTSYSNLRVIQADIAFKTGDLFARPESWPAAIAIYNRANDLAPNEDYYYLFLGRAYLEYAKTISDTDERDRLIEQAAQDLRKAQDINPLNTDHSANLARLYSLWSTFTQDPEQRQERARISEENFKDAVMLSPNNARLWDEWAVLSLNVLEQPDQAMEKLQRALELDPYYDWTYALMGDYYSRNLAEQYAEEPEKKNEALQKAVENYSIALERGEGTATKQLLYNYSIALGGVQAQLENIEQAIWAYEKALGFLPEASDRWRVQMALSQLFVRTGELSRALEYAQLAMTSAPEDQKAAINNMIAQLSGQP